MRANPRLQLYPGHSKTHFKHDTRPRGPSRAAPNFDTPAESFDGAKHSAQTVGDSYSTMAFPNNAVAATLAMHNAWAQNWAEWSRHCSDAFSLACPFYVFPFELMQQYFSFIFGVTEWVGEPVGQKRMAESQPDLRGDGPAGRVDADGQCEEAQKAMDIAIGADTEMWFETIQEGTSVSHEQQQRESVLATAA